MARPLSAALLRVLDRVGDTPDGWLLGRLADLADRWAAQPQARRELLVQWDALTGLLAHTSDKGLVERWTRLRADTEAALARLPSAPAVGTLTTTAPTTPPSAWGPDANDPAYGGSPYRRSYGGGRGG